MKLIIVTLCVFLVNVQVFAQSKIILTGNITETNTGESIIGAHIHGGQKGYEAQTDINGYFSLTLTKGENKIIIHYAGKDSLFQFTATKDTFIHFRLNTIIEIEELIVKAMPVHSVTGNRNSYMAVSSATLKQLPKLMGEGDVFKALQLMPGIHQTSEGSNNMSVRGGSGDQNQILLDGVEIYNPNHLLGFFSVFNEDAINSVQFYKGNIPAKYNGRSSSVTDIRLSEGNNQEYHVKGSIGLLSSRLLAEGPIIKENSSFLVTARVSQINLYAKPLVKKYTNFDNANYIFYDLTAKINYTLNNSNRLFLSFYNGLDDGNSETLLVYGDNGKELSDGNNTIESNQSRWGNSTYLLRWNKLIGSNAYFNLSANYSCFNYESNKKIVLNGIYGDTVKHTVVKDLSFSFNSSSFIEKININPEFFFPVGSFIKTTMGAQLSKLYTKSINESLVDSFNTLNNGESNNGNKQLMTIVNFFIDNKINVASNLLLNLGLNMSYIKTDNKLYTNLYPRLNCVYDMAEKSEIHASYSAMGQYLSQLSHNRVSLASDLWVSVTDKIQPAYSHLYSFGGSYTLPFGLKSSIDIFYSRMFRLLSYKEGQRFNNQNLDWQQQITTGKGHSYGVEFTLERNEGKITGWLNYTWSRSFRQFNDVNFGLEFPYKYDRPHDFKIVLFYKLNKSIEISPVWVLNSGANETVGASRIASAFELDQQRTIDISPYTNYSDGTDIMNFSYNSYRLPWYHRLDLSVNIHFKSNKRYNSTLSFGAYNIYNRENIYSLTMVPVGGQTQRYHYRIEEQSLFGIIPFINYGFSF